jgi:hypothetical protein
MSRNRTSKTPPWKRARADRRTSTTRKYNPWELGTHAMGWLFTLPPKIQAVVTTVTAVLVPGAIYAAVIDHLFGEHEGEESDLWKFLMSAVPDGISQDLHFAIANLTECLGRISADLVEELPVLIHGGKGLGLSAGDIVRQCREAIDEALDAHGLEACIQAVVDAK